MAGCHGTIPRTGGGTSGHGAGGTMVDAGSGDVVGLVAVDDGQPAC